MDDNIKIMTEYMLRALSIMDIQGWFMTLLGAVLVGGFAYISYLKSDRHMERAVSKKKMQARHREVIDIASHKIAESLNREVLKGELTVKEMEYILSMIHKGCPKMKDLGSEPNFGRPWYYGPASQPHAKAVKDAIWGRLRASGMSAKEIWEKRNHIFRLHSKSNKTAHEDMAALVASIKRAK